MKQLTLAIAGSILLFSCSNNEKDQSQATSENKIEEKDITLPEDICTLLTEQEVNKIVDVKDKTKEIIDDDSPSGIKYSVCGFQWEKSNFKELRDKKLDIMLNQMKEGKIAISKLINLESPYNVVKFGNFVNYESLSEAEQKFTNTHKTPTKKEVQKVKKEFDKEAEQQKLSEKQQELGNELTGGIASELKFKKVDGIGSQAFYSYIDNSLDVRFNTLSFKVYIDYEKADLNKEIEMAKEVAQLIWEKL